MPPHLARLAQEDGAAHHGVAGTAGVGSRMKTSAGRAFRLRAAALVATARADLPADSAGRRAGIRIDPRSPMALIVTHDGGAESCTERRPCVIGTLSGTFADDSTEAHQLEYARKHLLRSLLPAANLRSREALALHSEPFVHSRKEGRALVARPAKKHPRRLERPPRWWRSLNRAAAQDRRPPCPRQPISQPETR